MSKLVDTEGAYALMTDEGYTYVDVRTVEEYEAGHPKGAYNIPLMHRDAMGRMVPNDDFQTVMAASFPLDSKLVLGCRSGVRSARAADMLEGDGFTNLADAGPGWMGSRDGLPGWSDSDLPTEEGAPAGRRYKDLEAKARS